MCLRIFSTPTGRFARQPKRCGLCALAAYTGWRRRGHVSLQHRCAKASAYAVAPAPLSLPRLPDFLAARSGLASVTHYHPSRRQLGGQHIAPALSLCSSRHRSTHGLRPFERCDAHQGRFLVDLGHQLLVTGHQRSMFLGRDHRFSLSFESRYCRAKCLVPAPSGYSPALRHDLYDSRLLPPGRNATSDCVAWQPMRLRALRNRLQWGIASGGFHGHPSATQLQPGHARTWIRASSTSRSLTHAADLPVPSPPRFPFDCRWRMTAVISPVHTA